MALAGRADDLRAEAGRLLDSACDGCRRAIAAALRLLNDAEDAEREQKRPALRLVKGGLAVASVEPTSSASSAPRRRRRTTKRRA